jgi:Flp pilus assembly protein TadB
VIAVVGILAVLLLVCGLIWAVARSARAEERSKADAENATSTARVHKAYAQDPGKARDREDLERRRALRDARRRERERRGL